MPAQLKPSLLLLLMTLALAAPANASGLDAGKNASGLGVAYAGAAAVADNASVLRYNPAGLTLLEGTLFSPVATGRRHRYSFNDRESAGLAGDESGQAGQRQTLPHAYLAWPISDAWSLGLGIYSPYSLDPGYNDNWLGRNQFVRTEFDSLNFNPAIAYRVSDRLSLGFGLDYRKIRLKVAQEGARDSDSAWGWDAGAILTLSPSMRLGLAYQSGMKYCSPALPSAFPGVNDYGRFRTPGVLSFSVWQQISENWEAMGDFSYARWRSMDEYDRDSWRLSWGAAYAWNNHWKTRFGLAYDRSPITDSQRLALLPNSHRLWFSLGAQYRFGKASALDFGYAYQWAKKPRLDYDSGGPRLRGDYNTNGHILGIQYSQGF